MKDIFKSPEHQLQYNEHGYVVIEAGMEATADKLFRYITEQLTDISPDFYYSLIGNDLEANKTIRNKVKAELRPFYEKYLNDYKPLNESYLIKPAHTTDELLLHQDWCYTYEDKFHSLTLWMPLCDVDENNGALFFVPGSQHWFHNLRSSTLPTARILSTDIPADKMQKVAMKKGQVLLFHPATFHGSYPNNTGNHRIIVTSVVLPAEADYIYFHANGNHVKTFRLDEEVFLRELKTMAIGAEPQAEVVEQFDYNHRTITPADFLAGA